MYSILPYIDSLHIYFVRYEAELRLVEQYLGQRSTRNVLIGTFVMIVDTRCSDSCSIM
jgi:hypothetical protein